MDNHASSGIAAQLSVLNSDLMILPGKKATLAISICQPVFTETELPVVGWYLE
ncbi:hypothetical protein D3C87_674150 [compost metagenome]